ncbi:MAG: TRAM domain-containing protein, partial [candidate division Zixibacteria bacterium]
MTNRTVELEIEDMTYDGKAVGRIDGKVIFVNGGLPGEKIVAEITQDKARFSRGRMVDILRKAECRREAKCVHFGKCGGCSWQDINYEHQLTLKKKLVADNLQRLGGLEGVEIHDCLPSPDEYGYRNKMEFSFQNDPDGSFTVGLHHRGRWDEVFDLKECHLCSPVFSEINDWLRKFVKEQNLEPYDVGEHTGYMRFLVLREAKVDQTVMVNIVTNYGDFPCRDELVDGMTAAFPSVVTILHNQNGQKS